MKSPVPISHLRSAIFAVFALAAQMAFSQPTPVVTQASVTVNSTTGALLFPAVSVFGPINGIVNYTGTPAKGTLTPATASTTFGTLAIGTNGQVLTADSTQATGMKWAAGPATTFTALTDVPASYTGQALKVVSVNAGETALVFTALTGGGNALTSNPLSQFAATTSAQLAGVLTDETGTGANVFGTSPTINTPVLAGGFTASGSGSNTFAGSTGPFITSTGANTLSGAVTIADATTPSLTTAAGKTNTGFIQVNGKTSGALKLLPADATGQTVTIATAAQTIGAPTLTVPDMAGVSDTFDLIGKAQTLTNKTLVSPILTTPTLGVATATSLNGNTFTTGTYTITGAAAKILTFNATLTLAGTDGSTLNVGSGGTLGTAAYTATSAYEVPLTFSTGLTRTTNTITVNPSQNIATLSNLTTNGFIKTGGGVGTLSIDTNTYLTANQSITLSGDTTGSGTTAITTTIPAGTVTLAKMANLAANSFIGNNTGSPAVPLALTVAQSKTLLAIAQADVAGLTTASTPQFTRLGVGGAADAVNAVQITGGTVSADTHPIDITQTWNSGAVTFTGIKQNVTNSASNSASKLIDLQVGGVSKFSVDELGNVTSTNVSGVANPTATIGLTAINGSAATSIRSDGAPALSQAIAPTWTGIHTFAPTARTSGTAAQHVFTGGADTGLSASGEAVDYLIDISQTKQHATGALTTQRHVSVLSGTDSFVGASVVTNDATFSVDGPISGGTNATLTNAHAIYVPTKALGGAVTNAFAATFNAPTGATNNFALQTTGATTATAAPRTAGVATQFLFTGAADSGMTTATEAIDFQINLNQTKQHAAGALATQRHVVINAPTDSFVGASVVTDDATLAIDGPPSGGASATLTNTHGLLIQQRAVSNTTTASGITVNAPTGASTNWAGRFIGNITASGLENTPIGSVTPAASIFTSTTSFYSTVNGSNPGLTTPNIFVLDTDSGGTARLFSLGPNSSTYGTFAFTGVKSSGAGALLFATINSAGFSTTAGITSSSGTLGIGYTPGAGGTITQATSKSTGVTLNKMTGQITANGASLAANTAVSFVLTDSSIAATDMVHVWMVSGGSLNSYHFDVVAVGSGSCTIQIHNFSGGALVETLVLGFAVIKAVNS